MCSTEGIPLFMCHVAQVTSRYLCGQLLAVTIDLADSIVTVCRLVGHGARLDYIIAAGVALLLSDFGTLLEQEFDLLLKTVGVSPDLSQFLALEILQQFEGSNTVVIGAVFSRLRPICTMLPQVARQRNIKARFKKSLKGLMLVGGRFICRGMYSPLRSR